LLAAIDAASVLRIVRNELIDMDKDINIWNASQGVIKIGNLIDRIDEYFRRAAAVQE